MDISKIKPVKIGTKFIAKVNKFPNDCYLTTTSKGEILECKIDLAKEFNTIQEITDLAFAYVLGNKYV